MTGPDSEGLQALPASMVPSAGSIDAISNYDPDERAPVVPSVGAVPVEVPERQAAIGAVHLAHEQLGYEADEGKVRPDEEMDAFIADAVLLAAAPLIAARVRAEADAAWHALTEAILDQSNLFAADHEDDPDAWQLRVELLTATAGPAGIAAHDARVRAEERQRAAGMVQRFIRHSPTTDWAAVIELTNSILAAGSAVPVATPCKAECGKPDDQTCAQWGCRSAPTPEECDPSECVRPFGDDCCLDPTARQLAAVATQTEPACETCNDTQAVRQEGQIGVPGLAPWLSCPDCLPYPPEPVDPPAEQDGQR